MSTHEKKEKRLLYLFAIFVMTITTIPYLIGFFVQGSEWRFTGFVFSVEDGNAFIAKMLAGNVGQWLFRSPYTAFEQNGFLIFPTYILVGKLATTPFLHEKLVILYHVYRFLAGCLAILGTYYFISIFIRDIKFRFLGLSLGILGGGIGWVLLLFNRPVFFDTLPLSFYSPESFGFLSLLVYPHYSLARGMLFFSLIFFLKIVKDPYQYPIFREGLKLGVLWLLILLAQPFTGMVFGAICGIYIISLMIWQLILYFKNQETEFAILWKLIQLVVTALIISGPFILYNLVGTKTDSYIQAWTEQSSFTSPSPPYYLLAYGLTLPFAILGAHHLIQKKNWESKLPIVWALSLPILAYAPTGIQRRIPEGIWIAIVILAMIGIEKIKTPAWKRSSYLLLFCFPSSILLLIGGVTASWSRKEPVFRPVEEVKAFLSLSKGNSREDVILASYQSSNALPAWAPVYVLTGHGPESIRIDEISPMIVRFYQKDTTDSDRIDFIKEFGIDYVFWGLHERELGDWNPKDADYLSTHYESINYSIFEVLE